VLAALVGIADHPLLDRLIRGRAWIALLTFALIGIVTMQLGVLELSTGVGRSLAVKTSLERQIAWLQATDSALAAGTRVQAQAAQRGMQPAVAGSVRLLAASPADFREAAERVAAVAASAASSSSSAGSSAGSAAGSSAASAPGEAATGSPSAAAGTEAGAAGTGGAGAASGG
jgi:hypothetical protein